MVTNEQFDFFSKTSLKSYNLDEKIRYELSMLDTLDAYTRRHSENVASITCRLCENLKLDEKFTIYCTTCAYLHDIGKTFIPPSILQKPTRLTDEEYEVMKTHTTIGYNMCMKDPKLKPYANGALYHHEALNGTGYPNGVTSKDIPYEAKIIRVADEFEAITAKRQYKTHVGIVETLNLLINDAKPSNDNKPIVSSMSQGLGILSSESRTGKIDKSILRALFKVAIDDIEYEIAARTNYTEYLKEEIKRVNIALGYYNKMEKAKSPKRKEYYRNGAKACLRTHEEVDVIPSMYKEFKDALKERELHIKQLYSEARKIRKLTI